MKFVSFRMGGSPRYGLVKGDGVVDLTAKLDYPDLLSLIAANGSAKAAGVAADIYTEISRQFEKDLWMLEAHLDGEA